MSTATAAARPGVLGVGIIVSICVGSGLIFTGSTMVLAMVSMGRRLWRPTFLHTADRVIIAICDCVRRMVARLGVIILTALVECLLSQAHQASQSTYAQQLLPPAPMMRLLFIDIRGNCRVRGSTAASAPASASTSASTPTSTSSTTTTQLVTQHR